MLRPETLRPSVLGLLILGFGFAEFNGLGSALPIGIQSGSILETLLHGALAALVIGAVMAGAWAIRRHIEVVVVALFGAMMIATVLFSPAVNDPWSTRGREVAVLNKTTTPIKPLPPILHIILDQHIGIDGLPPKFIGSQTLRPVLREFYQSFGFRLFPSAFTHFPATVESITNLLNGRVLPGASAYVKGDPGAVRLMKNAWFRQLAARGYQIDVYQSRYLDFCAPGSDAFNLVQSCHTYNQGDVRYFHRMNIAPQAKAKLLFAYFVSVDFQGVMSRLLYFHHRLRLWLGSAGIDLAPWEFTPTSPSPLVTMDAMSRLSQRLETLRNGEALFAHLLLPHEPYVFDRRCHLSSSWTGRRSPLWIFNVGDTPERWAARYRAYLDQIRCVHAKLGGILIKMRNLGLLEKSIIVIHGDHGSMIPAKDVVSLNAGKLSERDIIDIYSTLFAVKMPGAASGNIAEQRSIQYLFAHQVAGWTNVKPHNDIFLAPNNGVVGPGQIRRGMVSFGAATENRSSGAER